MSLRFFLSSSALLVALLVAPSPGLAEAPPSDPAAEIVFSNAGRIVSIKADGSQRRVLTRNKTQLLRRDSLADIHHYGDSRPAISPDGKKLAFVRTLPAARTHQVMIANRDGSNARGIRGNGGDIQTLDWMPDGRLLLTTWHYHYGRRIFETYRILAVNIRTGKKQILLSRRFNGNYVVDVIRAQESSPDGGSILYFRDFGEGDNGEKQTQLRILDLKTGRDRGLVGDAVAGSFSPDGDRVAFTRTCVDWGYFNCPRDRGSGVWTVDADGSNPTRIITGEGEYDSPDWAPNGEHIIFASTRNYPAEGRDSNEIYSVQPDGECVTWLTNGSPESIMPSWAPETGVRTDPGPECGDAGRKPLAEARPPKPKKTDPRPRYWAGPQAAGRLLSKIEGYAQEEFGNQLYRYGDCPHFDSSLCRRAITLELARACSPIGEVRIPPRGRSTLSARRGVKLRNYLTARGKLASTILRVGPVRVGVGRSMLDVERDTGKPIGVEDHLALIDALRPVGGKLEAGSNLPSPTRVKCSGRKRR